MPLPHTYLKAALGLEKESVDSFRETNAVKEGAVLAECGSFAEAGSRAAGLLLDAGQSLQALLA